MDQNVDFDESMAPEQDADLAIERTMLIPCVQRAREQARTHKQPRAKLTAPEWRHHHKEGEG